MNITNQPILNSSFRANDSKLQNMNKQQNKYIEKSLITIAALGVSLAIAAPYTKKDIFKGLKSNGLEIKNGLIVSSKTGEKFTGTIKYNSKPFGLEKESVSYLDGKTTEIVHHSITGKELNGYFFKNGKLYLTVGNITRNKNRQFYPCYEHDLEGKVIKVSDCFAEPNESIFDKIRKSINK